MTKQQMTHRSDNTTEYENFIAVALEEHSTENVEIMNNTITDVIQKVM